MPRDSRRLWLALAAGGVVVLAAAVAFLVPRGHQPTSPGEFTTTVLNWQAPSQGAVVATYLLRIQDVQAATEDTFTVEAQPGPQQRFSFTRARPGHEYRACIAGVDARGRQGPWSDWSPVYRRAPGGGRP